MPQYVTANSISSSSLWLGVPNLSEEMLKNFDPAYTGHTHIFLIRTPKIFDLYYAEHKDNLKAILERTTTSFTGIPELTLNFQDQTHGFADRHVSHATSAEFNFDQGTLRCLEFKGLPTYTMIRDWIENISDPISKIGDYKGRAGVDQSLEYSIANHTASFIVCTTDPTHTRLQGRAHYITAAMPTAITNEHYNMNAGEIGIIDGFDIAFKGVLRWGQYIDQKATDLLAARKAVINYIAERNDAKSLTKEYKL